MTVHALYRIFDPDDVLLYVGITNNPRSRMMDHVRSKSWARWIKYITFEHFTSRGELIAAERKAIVTECPEYNTAYRNVSPAEYDPEYSDAGYE